MKKVFDYGTRTTHRGLPYLYVWGWDKHDAMQRTTLMVGWLVGWWRVRAEGEGADDGDGEDEL